MALKVGELFAVLRLDKSDYKSGLADARQEAARTGQAIQSAFAIGAKSVGLLSTAATGAVVSLQSVGAGYNILSQTARASLSAIMGSAEDANDQMDRLFKFTSTSPLPKQAFIQAQQTLIGFGVEAKKIVPILTAINDAAVATATGAEGVDRLSQSIARVQSQGKLTGDALFQMGSMGIDAAQMVADATGKTVAETRKAVTDGAIDSTSAISAIIDGMEARYGGASKNVKDQFVGASDRIKAAWRDLGSVLNTPLIDPNGGGNLVVWFNDVADVLRSTQHLAERFMDVLHDRDAGASLDGIHTGLQDIAHWIDQIDTDKISAFLDTLRDYAPIIGGIGAAFVTLGAQQIPIIGSLVASWNPWLVGLAAAAVQVPEVRDLTKELFAALQPLVPLVGGLVGAASGVLEMVRPLVGVLADLVGWFTKLPGPVQLLIAGFVGVVAYRAPLVSMFETIAIRGMLARDSFVALAGGATGLRGAFNVAKGAGSGLITFLGGPWVVGIGAAVAGVALLADAWQDAQPKVRDFTGLIDENTGALSENARQAAVASAKDDLVAWDKLGGDVETYTSALLGNKDALAQVRRDMQGMGVDLLTNSEAWSRSGNDFNRFGFDIVDVTKAMLDSIGGSNTKLNEMRTVMGDAFPDLSLLEGAFGSMTGAVNQFGSNVDQSAKSMAEGRIAAKALADGNSETAQSFLDLMGVTQQYGPLADGYASGLDKIAGSGADASDTLKTVDDRVTALSDSMTGAIGSSDSYNSAVLALIDSQQDVAQSMTDAEFAAKKAGQSVFDSAGDFDLSQSAVRDLVGQLTTYRNSAISAASATYESVLATQGASAATAAMQDSLAGAQSGLLAIASAIFGTTSPAVQAIASQLGVLQSVQIDDKSFTVTMFTVKKELAEGQYSDSWMRRINQDAAGAAAALSAGIKMPNIGDILSGVTQPKASGGGGGRKSGGGSSAASSAASAAKKAADDTKRAQEKAQQDAERAAQEAARKEQARQEAMARTVTGTFDQIGRAVQVPFNVAEFGIAGVENQIARSQRSLTNAIAHGLDPKQADALRKQLADMTSEAQKQLGALRIKITTSDLDAFRDSLTGTVDQMSASVAQLQKDLRAAGASSTLRAALVGIEDQLGAAMSRREQVTKELSDAQSTLNGLMDQYRQRVDAVTGSFMSFAAITNVEAQDRWGGNLPMEAIIAQMEDRAKVADKFTKDVEALRRSGLNETTLQQIISAGPGSAAAQASVLASATSAELQKINSLTAQVFGDGTRTGSLSAEFMYRSGINAAQSVVDGLISEQSNLQETIENLAGSAEILVASEMKKQGVAAADGVIAGVNSRKAALISTMETLGVAMTKAFKKSLDINSPSGVMNREVGVPVVDGVIAGMMKRSPALTAAAANMRGILVGKPGASGTQIAGASGPILVKLVVTGGDEVADLLMSKMRVEVGGMMTDQIDVQVQRDRAGVRH